jgi:hypothetical protein
MASTDNYLRNRCECIARLANQLSSQKETPKNIDAVNHALETLQSVIEPSYEQKEYDNLVKVMASPHRPATPWDAIAIAREEDVILDTNGACNTTFRYLIFKDRGKYERYLERYIELPNMAHQFRIIPSTTRHSLTFEVVNVEKKELLEIVSFLKYVFKKSEDDILIIALPEPDSYEITILSEVNVFAENRAKIDRFRSFVDERDHVLAEKIRQKKVSYGNLEDVGVFRMIQTGKAVNGKLKYAGDKIFKIVVNNTINSNNSINGNQNSMSNTNTTNSENAESALSRYINDHPPASDQASSKYYRQVLDAVKNVSQTDITNTLRSKGFSQKRIKNVRTWRK